MFCDHCGKPLNIRSQYCTACGTRILPGASISQATAIQMAPADRVRRNIGVLAVLWAINGVIRLLETFAFTFIGPLVLPHVFGFHNWFGWDFPLRGLWPFSMGLAWISVLFGAFGVVHLVLAWGLSERKAWARPLGLIVGFLALIRFPLGTALGAYTLWVLLPEPSAREYDEMAVV